MLNLKAIVHGILKDYALPWDGIHGVSHWARVLENGLRLTELTGATLDRLTHRCHILETRGDSYRLREAKRRRGGKRDEGSDGAQEGDEEGRD